MIIKIESVKDVLQNQPPTAVRHPLDIDARMSLALSGAVVELLLD